LIRAIRVRVGAGDAAVPDAAVPDSIARLLGITRREREIIEHLLAGKTDREIAELLYISPRTVETHLRNIYLKCDVTSRMQLSHRLAEFRARTKSD
jgi:DNA-binding CsgD family transcriptional regulator